MNRHADRAVTVARAVVAGARSEGVTFIAASLAYYALVSLVPLLALALVVGTAVSGPAFAEAVGAWVAGTLGEQAGAVVTEALSGAAGEAGATVVGLAVLLWSGLRLFRGLDVAFSLVYDAPAPESLVEQVRDGAVVLGAVGLGIAATVGVGALVAAHAIEVVLAGVDLVGVLATVALLAGLTLTFLPLYVLLPAEGVTVREALPGAALAAVGWTALQTGFRVYARAAGTYEAYGVLGGVLLLVTLLYAGGLLLLVGAVLNAVLAGRLDPDDDLAVRSDGGRKDDSPTMPESDTFDDEAPDDEEELREEVRELRAELAEFEERVDERTLHRDEVEADLRQYVRERVRRGKARGWGPYLVLLYGTAMTLGAFVELSGGWAIAAMVVVWLSTLGLYVLMLLVGATVSLGGGLAGVAGSVRDRVR